MTEDDRSPAAGALHDFATWEPLLRVLRDANAEALAAPGGHLAGRIGQSGWSLPTRPRFPRNGRALQIEDAREEHEAVDRVRIALGKSGAGTVSFAAEISSGGRTVLRLYDTGPAVEPGIGNAYPGSLLLVEGALPEPWRRLPAPAPGAEPAPTADPALLERTLRERLPDAVGATETEIAAAEARLGMALPEELRALYRVTRARCEDPADDREALIREISAVGVELLPLDRLAVADASSRPAPWRFAAMEAVNTPPGAAVQGLVGSPGWIEFGGNGGGDRLAIDLTPGPGGHVGQVIMLSHEENIGAELVADSLTGLVLNGWWSGVQGDRSDDRPPAAAHVNVRRITSVADAAHEGLEALSLGVWESEPFSLAPVVGLPRLRTLRAYPGTLADPLEIARLPGLEFLELCPEDWRILLDAGAVPRGLAAAAIEVRERIHPGPVMALANEILSLRGRPLIAETVLEGDLGEAR